MVTNDSNSKALLKVTRIIFFAMIAGLLTFLVMTLYVNEIKYSSKNDLAEPLFVVNFILCCVALPGGYFFAKAVFNKIDPSDLLRNKLFRFQSGQIFRLASCEGVGLFAIVNLLLTSKLMFLIFLIIPLLTMFLYYPTPEKVGREINLTQTEIDILKE
jgi:hypothetical protein